MSSCHCVGGGGNSGGGDGSPSQREHEQRSQAQKSDDTRSEERRRRRERDETASWQQSVCVSLTRGQHCKSCEFPGGQHITAVIGRLGL